MVRMTLGALQCDDETERVSASRLHSERRQRMAVRWMIMFSRWTRSQTQRAPMSTIRCRAGSHASVNLNDDRGRAVLLRDELPLNP
jgi:hypothetical protein